MAKTIEELQADARERILALEFEIESLIALTDTIGFMDEEATMYLEQAVRHLDPLARHCDEGPGT